MLLPFLKPFASLLLLLPGRKTTTLDTLANNEKPLEKQTGLIGLEELTRMHRTGRLAKSAAPARQALVHT